MPADASLLTRSGLDLDIAVLLAEASLAAYDEALTPEEWAGSRGFARPVSFNQSNVQGFWTTAPGGVALLAFRGTSNIGQWLRDANFLPASHPWGRVHAGFADGVRDVEAHLQAFDAAAAAAPHFWITGHSLGGALAVIAAARFRMKGLNPSLYTYGQPRVGLGGFRDTFESELPGRLHRFVNQSDIVPRVPPGLLYRHLDILKRIVRPGSLEAGEVVEPELVEIEMDPLTEEEFAALQERLRNPGMDGEALEGIFDFAGDHSISEYLRLLTEIRDLQQ